MIVQDLMFKVLVGINIRIVDDKKGNEIISGVSGYIMNYPNILLKKVNNIDIENNEMIIRVR